MRGVPAKQLVPPQALDSELIGLFNFRFNARTFGFCAKFENFAPESKLIERVAAERLPWKIMMTQQQKC